MRRMSVRVLGPSDCRHWAIRESCMAQRLDSAAPDSMWPGLSIQGSEDRFGGTCFTGLFWLLLIYTKAFKAHSLLCDQPVLCSAGPHLYLIVMQGQDHESPPCLTYSYQYGPSYDIHTSAFQKVLGARRQAPPSTSSPRPSTAYPETTAPTDTQNTSDAIMMACTKSGKDASLLACNRSSKLQTL
jgi:hypothetical protein